MFFVFKREDLSDVQHDVFINLRHVLNFIANDGVIDLYARGDQVRLKFVSPEAYEKYLTQLKTFVVNDEARLKKLSSFLDVVSQCGSKAKAPKKATKKSVKKQANKKAIKKVATKKTVKRKRK